MDCISIYLRMNPPELIPSDYNFLAQFVEFILNEDNRADETYFFEVVGSDEDGWLVDVANVYDVIKLEIEDVLLPDYRLLVVLVPQPRLMH